MTLAKLKSIVASIFDRSSNDLITNDGVDLFLETANEVRRNAEMNWNFEFSRIRAELDIDGIIGGDLDQAQIEDSTVFGVVGSVGTPPTTVLGNYGYTTFFNFRPNYINDLGFYLYFNTPANSYVLAMSQVDIGVLTDYFVPASPVSTPMGTSTTTLAYVGHGVYTGITVVLSILVAPLFVLNRIKEVVAFQRQRADKRLIPMDFTRADIPIERDRWVYELRDDFWPAERYPSDAQVRARSGRATLIQRGRKIFIYPAWPPLVPSQPPLHVFMECIGLLRDYTETDYKTNAAPDFLMDFGAEFMKWEIVIQLNPIYQKFVTRQEGNVGNDPKLIEKYRDDAWRKLTVWDSYQIDANSTRSR